MKKVLALTLSMIIITCCFDACDSANGNSGDGSSEITGFILYIYAEGENAIDTFSTGSDENKEINLLKGKTYKIGARPSVRGSKSAVYVGDCAEFIYAKDCCEIKYLQDRENHPIYEFIIITEDDFSLTVVIDNYVQTINISVC